MGTQGSKSEDASDAHLHPRKDGRAIILYRRLCGNGVELTTKQLIQHFPEYGHPLITRLFSVSQTDHNSAISEDDFVGVMENILGPRSPSSLSQFYFESFCGSENLQENDVKLLVETAFSLFLATCELSPNMASVDREAIDHLVQTIHSKGNSRSGLDWMETSCPELLMGMHHWFVARATPSNEVDSADASVVYTLPNHDGAILSVGRWWMIASSLPSLYTQPKTSTQPSSSGAGAAPTSQASTASKQPWTLLYSSREHGLSVNRLQHHVLGYKGPTVFVVSCEGGVVYAVALDTEWREGTLPWGGVNCSTIRLSPDYSVLEEGDNMMLFNDKSRNLPKGLFIGRDPKRRVVSLTEGLQTVTHRGLTGQVVNAEVWGCASSDVKVAQAKQKKTELKDAERNAKVQLPGQWDDNPDRQLLGWGTARTDYADGFREDRQDTSDKYM